MRFILGMWELIIKFAVFLIISFILSVCVSLAILTMLCIIFWRIPHFDATLFNVVVYRMIFVLSCLMVWCGWDAVEMEI
jgi:uncharacterized BrkB/YihY/UPF0761 family membrane protein